MGEEVQQFSTNEDIVFCLSLDIFMEEWGMAQTQTFHKLVFYMAQWADLVKNILEVSKYKAMGH